MPLPPAAGTEVHAECLFTLPSLAYLLPLPWTPYQTTALRHLTQEEGERAQAAAAELQASVEELRAREAAGEGQLQQSLATATQENRQLKEQLAVRLGWADGCAGVQTKKSMRCRSTCSVALCTLTIQDHRLRSPSTAGLHAAGRVAGRAAGGGAGRAAAPGCQGRQIQAGAWMSWALVLWIAGISMHFKLSTYRY